MWTIGANPTTWGRSSKHRYLLRYAGNYSSHSRGCRGRQVCGCMSVCQRCWRLQKSTGKRLVYSDCQQCWDLRHTADISRRGLGLAGWCWAAANLSQVLGAGAQAVWRLWVLSPCWTVFISARSIWWYARSSPKAARWLYPEATTQLA